MGSSIQNCAPDTRKPASITHGPTSISLRPRGKCAKIKYYTHSAASDAQMRPHQSHAARVSYTRRSANCEGVNSGCINNKKEQYNVSLTPRPYLSVRALQILNCVLFSLRKNRTVVKSRQVGHSGGSGGADGSG